MATSLDARRLAAAPFRRAERWSLVGLAALLMFGGGIALAFGNAAVRTRDAYDDYVSTARVSDLVIDPTIATPEIEAAVRSFPEVRDMRVDTLLLASPTDGTEAGMARASGMLQVRGSTDGRYSSTDRPVVTRGRLPTGDHEVFIALDALHEVERTIQRRVAVGDTITMTFAHYRSLDASDVVKIRDEPVRVVGMGRLPDEALPDDLYPRQRVIVSPDLTRTYGCVQRLSPTMTAEQAMAAMLPPGCSTDYRYFALRLSGGTRGASKVLARFAEAAKRLDPSLPPAAKADGTGYIAIASDRSVEAGRILRATRPTVTSLALFGLATGLATIIVAGLLVVRISRRRRAVVEIERGLGLTRADRSSVMFLAVVPAVMAGVGGALVLALASSPVAPVGVARAFDPRPGLAVSGWLAIVAAVGVVMMIGAVALVAGWFAGPDHAVRPRRRRGAAVASSHPAVDQGVRAATGGAGPLGAILTLAGCVAVIVTMVAAIVFASNYATLVASPREYGWPWDAAVVTGSGYGNANVTLIAKDLTGRHDVAAWGVAGVDSAGLVGGRLMPIVVGGRGFDRMLPPLVSGRAPVSTHEVALGRSTARSLGVEMGARITASSFLLGNSATYRVVGIIVEPPLGQFAADRAGMGVGAYFARGDDLDPRTASLVAIDTRRGISGRQLIDALGDRVVAWDESGDPPTAHTVPVRPPEIIDADNLRRLPVALSLAMGVAMMLGLSVIVLLSVRDRRREILIMRVLGFTRSQVGASVRWQAVTTIALALLVGIPLGWIAGRTTWLEFANSLGARPTASLPIGWIAVASGAMVLAGVVAAIGPIRAATRPMRIRELNG